MYTTSNSVSHFNNQMAAMARLPSQHAKRNSLPEEWLWVARELGKGLFGPVSLPMGGLNSFYLRYLLFYPIVRF